MHLMILITMGTVIYRLTYMYLVQAIAQVSLLAAYHKIVITSPAIHLQKLSTGIIFRKRILHRQPQFGMMQPLTGKPITVHLETSLED